MSSGNHIFNGVDVLSIKTTLVVLVILFNVFLCPNASNSITRIKTISGPVRISMVIQKLASSGPSNLFTALRGSSAAGVVVHGRPCNRIGVGRIHHLPHAATIPRPSNNIITLPSPHPRLGFAVSVLVALAKGTRVASANPIFNGDGIGINAPVRLSNSLCGFGADAISIQILRWDRSSRHCPVAPPPL